MEVSVNLARLHFHPPPPFTVTVVILLLRRNEIDMEVNTHWTWMLHACCLGLWSFGDRHSENPVIVHFDHEIFNLGIFWEDILETRRQAALYFTQHGLISYCNMCVRVQDFSVNYCCWIRSMWDQRPCWCDVCMQSSLWGELLAIIEKLVADHWWAKAILKATCGLH